MRALFQSGQTWWNRNGGGAFIDRIDGATIWYTKVKHSGMRTSAGALLQRSVFMRKYPLQEKPVVPSITLRPWRDQPAYFTLRVTAEQLADVEDVYVGMMGDTGIDEPLRQLAEQIARACEEARGDASRRRSSDPHGSRIVRVRPLRTGVR